MSNTQAIALIVGIAMPFVITILKQVGFPKWANLLIAAVSCIAAGVLTAWAAGQLNAANVVGAIAAVFIAAQATYAAYWKNTDTDDALNAATSIFK